jgi:dihydroorotate dehydrogenase
MSVNLKLCFHPTTSFRVLITFATSLLFNMIIRSVWELRLRRNSSQSIRLFPARPVLRAVAKPRLIRLTSTDATRGADANSLVSRLKNILYGTSLTLFLALSYLYVTDTRASIHQWLAVPAMRLFYPDAEDAHHAGTKLLKTFYASNLHPRERGCLDAQGDLSISVFGHKLQNPIGTSAGIDKLAEIPDALLALGGAVVEVGGATPFPQDGNPRPRVFRLPSQKALINRYGLNSLGAEDMAMRLRERVRHFAYRNGFGVDEEAERLVLDGEAGVPPGSLTLGKLLLVQIAKNKFTPENDIQAVKRDYVFCVEQLGKYADVLVVNVSSPNTPGLRDLQAVEPLTELLKGVVEAAARTQRKERPRVMVKVSPDEDEASQIEGIVEAVWKSGVDGVVVGNTTNRRSGLVPADQQLSPKLQSVLVEKGGYSGPQMFERTLSLVKHYRRLLDQGLPGLPRSNQHADVVVTNNHNTSDEPSSTPSTTPPPTPLEAKVIFATGGITNGKQALEILNAGSSLAMVYTALVYGGAGKISSIKKEMREEIAKNKEQKRVD